MSRCQKSVIERIESSSYTSHFFAATLVSFWLSVCQTNAQSRETAFGQTHTVSVPGQFDKFALRVKPGTAPRVYFWADHGTNLGSGKIGSTAELADWQTHTLARAADDFMIVDMVPEKKQVGVAIERGQHLMTFYDNLDADTLRPTSTVTLPFTSGNVVFGDLNNDGRTDFLAYDRERPGIIPFFGIGNNKFREGKPFALDNAVSALQLVHLNNDNLIDIVFYDWVRSDLHLLYGIGQGKFLDQASIRTDGTVEQIEATPLKQHGNISLVLSCSSPAKIQVLEGNGMGDFRVGSELPLKEPLMSMFVADVNNDENVDIVGMDRASMLRVFMNGGDGLFEDRLDFTGPRGVSDVALASVDGTAVDVIAFEKDQSKVQLLMNAVRKSVLADSIDFSTGARPRGVTIADANGDGLNDIVVATAGSNSLSFYFNRNGLGLLGQSSFSLPASAHDVAFHSVKDSVVRVLVSYPESRQLSLFSLDEKEWSTTNATIGTERAVEFLYLNGSGMPNVEFFCFGPSVAATPASLTLFQEIQSHQFVERSFMLSPNNTLLGAGVGRLNRDSIPDVAFVYRNNASGKNQLAISLGDSLYAFRQRTDLVELPQKNLTRSYIWLADLDKDGRDDIIMLNDGPVSVLEKVRHLRDAFYTPLDTIALDVQITDWAQVRFCDLDGDGNADIIVNDVNKGQIGWFRGNGKSSEPFQPLCSAPRRSHFAVGDLNGDGTPDIVVTFGDQGIFRVYDGKYLLKRAHETGH